MACGGLRLCHFAKKTGVTYKTAYRWWKAGLLDAYQLATGTIIVREPLAPTPVNRDVVLYARVSSADQKQDLERQLDRLRDYAAAKGYLVSKEVTELASGLNDQRTKISKLLTDPKIGVIVVEHKDRLTALASTISNNCLRRKDDVLKSCFPLTPMTRSSKILSP